MKKSFDFNISSHFYLPTFFTQNFALTYMFLENIPGEENEKVCFFFDAMTGGNSLRDHYDGKPTKAKKLIGDFEDYQFGTDFTVDFLFGFAGYEYRRLTENSMFKSEIIKSVDADKPVIAKVKNYGFCIITGYDGDSLISPNFNREDRNFAYDEIDTIFVIGDKEKPRYTLTDGLKNIKNVMECTVKENIWEHYIDKMTWEWSNKPSLEERKERMKRIADNGWAVMICHFFAEVFRHRWYAELQNPAFDEMFSRIGHINGYMCSLAWGLDCINKQIDWSFDEHADGMTRIVALTIEKMKQVDLETLDIIKQAIEIL